MKNYFKNKAISNSLLKRVGFFFQEQMLNRFSFEQEEKETESMFIGSQVHKAIETNGANIDKLKVLDTRCFTDKDINGNSVLTASEIKILKSEFPEKEYFNVYDNVNSRLAQTGWSKETLDAKEAKAVQKVKDHITDIMFKGSSYLTSKMGVSSDDLILNEYKLINGEKESFISDPELCRSKIVKSYNAVEQSFGHQNLIDRDIFEQCIEHFELEYYTEMFGYKVKGMFDRVIILPEQKRAVLIDYKTYSNGSIEKSIIKFGYCTQLSWYQQLFEQWLKENNHIGYSVEVSVVGISTDSYKVDVVPISIKASQCGRYGGYAKPSLYTLYNEQEEFDPYLSESDVAWLKHNNIWSSTKNNQFKKLGWNECFNIGIEAELFEEYKV
jgi:hypothetical protein